MDYSRLGNMRRRRRQNSQTIRIRNKISLLTLRAVLAVALVVVFALPAMGIGAWLGVLSYAPDLLPHGVRQGDYASQIICPRTGEVIQTLHRGINRTHIPLEYIPQHLRDAFIAIEDERFFYHNGVDMRSMGRAMFRLVNPNYNTSEGASTITQQLIKNRLRRFDSDLTTKLQEQYLAVRFERELTEQLGCRIAAKNYILQEYLNTINLGRTNHGVQAAANFYFGVDPMYLSIAQAASIAAITQNPTWLVPDRHPERNWERATHVLNSMLRLGFITEEEHYEAINTDVYATIVRNDDGELMPTTSPFSCFTEATINQVVEDLMEAFNLSRFEANEWLNTRGLRIFSTQDRHIQAIVDDVMLDDTMFPTGAGRFEIYVTYVMTTRNTLTNQISNRRRSRTVSNMEQAEAAIYEMQSDMLGTHDEILSDYRIFLPQPQAAFILMDQHNGHVLAIRGIRGERVVSRMHCRATVATRSPGSQLKPLVFAAGFDMGILSPVSPIEDAPWGVQPVGGQFWSPNNWWSGGFRGMQTARAAIHTSMNVVSARALVDYVGIDAAFAYMLNLGFTTLEGTLPDGRAFSDRIPALSLGGLTQGVILLELAAAYAAIANEGMYNRPIFYTHILDQDGNLLLENNRAPRQVLRRESAYLLTHTMMDTLNPALGATGGGQRFDDLQMRRDIPIAGKTGTSQQGRDSGFVGYTPYFTAAVWLGFDVPRPLPHNFTRYRESLWRTIMERVHYGLPPRSFVRPSGIVTSSVCRDSGLLATDLCRTDPRGNRTVSDLFASGNIPTQHCHVHQQLRICDVSGLLAGDSCHPMLVSYRVGMMLPPLPDWAAGTHVPGRQYAFSRAVLEGHVCINCQYHHHEWFNPEEPDDDYDDYNEPPSDGGFNWPWDTPQPTPSPGEYTDYPHQPDYNDPPTDPGQPPYNYSPHEPPTDDNPYETGSDYQD